jgi:hypothetical protein
MKSAPLYSVKDDIMNVLDKKLEGVRKLEQVDKKLGI